MNIVVVVLVTNDPDGEGEAVIKYCQQIGAIAYVKSSRPATEADLRLLKREGVLPRHVTPEAENALTLPPLADLFKQYKARVRKDYKGKLLAFCHVFSDNIDSYFDKPYETQKALDAFKRYAEERGCARLYVEVADEEGNTLIEDCILSEGGFPY